MSLRTVSIELNSCSELLLTDKIEPKRAGAALSFWMKVADRYASFGQGQKSIEEITKTAQDRLDKIKGTDDAKKKDPMLNPGKTVAGKSKPGPAAGQKVNREQLLTWLDTVAPEKHPKTDAQKKNDPRLKTTPVPEAESQVEWIKRPDQAELEKLLKEALEQSD